VRAWLSLSVAFVGGVAQSDASAEGAATRVLAAVRRVRSVAVQELFHLSLLDDWAAAQQAGEITDSTRDVTLDEEGYIHCSFADQVAATASRFYGDLEAVVLLRLDPDLVTSPIVVEDLVGSGVEFPHVYGPIPIAAVTDAQVTAPDQIAF
jgi:uncharacterized protein (DUF952 family)